MICLLFCVNINMPITFTVHHHYNSIFYIHTLINNHSKNTHEFKTFISLLHAHMPYTNHMHTPTYTHICIHLYPTITQTSTQSPL